MAFKSAMSCEEVCKLSGRIRLAIFRMLPTRTKPSKSSASSDRRMRSTATLLAEHSIIFQGGPNNFGRCSAIKIMKLILKKINIFYFILLIKKKVGKGLSLIIYNKFLYYTKENIFNIIACLLI
jgi:hypothetical protein